MPIRNRIMMLFAAMALVGNSFASVDDSSTTIKWDYKGSTGSWRWGSLDPAFALCATGKLQSPINIKTQKHTLAQPDFKLNYAAIPLEEGVNDATSLRIGEQYLVINDGHSVQLNVPDDHQGEETLLLHNQLHHLVQFHFHTPSENQLNGETASGEIHFVNQGKNGELAVIAVFIKVGAANPIIETILNHLSAASGQEVTIADPLNIGKLIPNKKDGYRFMGSLTTPPCTEGVEWLVLADPITASSEQIVKLRQAANGSNARPVQPLNKRPTTFVTEIVK